MKKSNKSIFIFIILSFISLLFIIYTSELSTQTVFIDDEGERLILKKSDSFIEYGSKDMVFIRDEENTIYISLEILSKHLNVKTSYDPDDEMAIITTLDKVIRFYGKTSKVKVNSEEVDYISPMLMNAETPLIPISQIKEDLKIEYSILEDSIVVRSLFDGQVVGASRRDNVFLKQDRNPWSRVIGILNHGEVIQIMGEEDGWIKVITPNGGEGFLKKRNLENMKAVQGIKWETNSALWQPERDKIFLAWESVYTKNPITSKIKNMSGLNVISPTWIHLVGSSGKLKNTIGKDYIAWAKKRDYKIWALFTNSFDPKLTDEFLNNSAARERVINELLRLIKDNGMDGINIDFENVYLKNKELLVQFVREMTPIFRENDLIVSIDVTVIGGSDNWSRFLDRKALGEVVDYMAVMTYDEHWASSPKSGSVASLGWVERGIERILEEVPAEKLLLGVPFYTRVWTETPSEKDPNKMNVKSKAISMKAAEKILQKENIVKLWDEDAGQYYVVYIEDNKIHKMWHENAKSIKLKTDLVNKYNLAGVAAWRRGFETEDIWITIDNNINRN